MTRSKAKPHRTPNRKIRCRRSNIKILHRQERRPESLKIDRRWECVKRLIF